MAQVIEIVFQPAGDLSVAGHSMNLCPSRDSRFQPVTQAILPQRLAESGGKMSAFRAWAHDAHVTLEHVPELRPFIQTKPPERGPQASGISGSRRAPLGFAGIRWTHRQSAELVHAEAASVGPDPLLNEEDGSWRAELDENSDQCGQRRADDQGRRCQQYVESALG